MSAYFLKHHHQFINDTPSEIEMVRKACAEKGVKVELCQVWEKGGKGGEVLAQTLLDLLASNDDKPRTFKLAYNNQDSIIDKIRAVATRIYGADDVEISSAALSKIRRLEKAGLDKMPICIAKTQYSLTDDAKRLGRPTGFNIHVRDISVSAGAGFIVVICGNIMRMPGLPKIPSANHIDIDAEGNITGLS